MAGQKKTYTFLSPEQMAAQNPWAALANQPLQLDGMHVSGMQATQADLNEAQMAAQAAENAPAPSRAVTITRPASAPAMPAGPKSGLGVTASPIFQDAAALAGPLGQRGKFDVAAEKQIKDESANKEESGNKTVETKNLYMSPEEVEAITGSLYGLKPMQDMRAGIAAQEKLAQEVVLGAPSGVDLTPLMALADAWTGSKFAQSYKAPPGFNDRAKLLLDYGDKLTDNKRQVADKLLSLIPYMKSGQMQNQITNATVMQSSQGTTMGDKLTAGSVPSLPKGSSGQGTKLDAKKYMETFRNIPEVKDTIPMVTAANAIVQNASNPNWLTDAGNKGNILQALRMYPVSDKDAALVEGSQDIRSRLSRMLQRVEQGGIFVPADRKVIMDYAKLQQKVGAAILERNRREYQQGMKYDQKNGFQFDDAQGQQILKAVIPEVKESTAPSQSDTVRKLLQEALK